MYIAYGKLIDKPFYIGIYAYLLYYISEYIQTCAMVYHSFLPLSSKGSPYFPNLGTTNLHLDMSDAVNVLVYANCAEAMMFEAEGKTL